MNNARLLQGRVEWDRLMHTNSAGLPYTEAEVEWYLPHEKVNRRYSHALDLDGTGEEHQEQDKETECLQKRTQGFYCWDHVRQHTIPEELNNKELDCDEHHDDQETYQDSIHIAGRSSCTCEAFFDRGHD